MLNRYLHRWSILQFLHGLLLLWAAIWSPVLAQTYTRPTTIDPRVTIKETHHHSEIHGTCFWLVLDLEQLPEFTRPLIITPTNSVFPIQRNRVLTADEDSRAGRLSRLFGALSGKKPTFTNPIPPPEWDRQVAYCIDKGVSNLSYGAMMVTKLPDDKKLNVLVPHSVMNETRTVYFMFPKGEFASKMGFMQSPPLEPDSVLPDLEMTFVRARPQRHHGASGQMVTCIYWFPVHYLIYGETHGTIGDPEGMVPEITVNDQFPVEVFLEKGRYPDPVQTPSDSIRFFIPDALLDANGKAKVDMRFNHGGFQKIHAKPLELSGRSSADTLNIHAIEFKKLLENKASHPGSLILYLTVGNAIVTPPLFADLENVGKRRVPYQVPQSITIPYQEGDSVGVRFIYSYGMDTTKGYLPYEYAPQSTFLKPQKLRHRQQIRRIWRVKGMYEPPFWQLTFKISQGSRKDKQ